MVKVNDDSETRHEEQEEHNPELLYAPLTAPSLPEESDKTENERQAIEDVMSFILTQLVGELALVAIHSVIYKRNTCNPVAMLSLAVALNIILSAGKVPHEVAPIHEVALV